MLLLCMSAVPTSYKITVCFDVQTPLYHVLAFLTFVVSFLLNVPPKSKHICISTQQVS